MPRYRFTGFHETVLTGLQHGVNAELHRDDHGQPDQSTVVAQPGDEITTCGRYPHALMVNTETGEPDLDWFTIGDQAPVEVKRRDRKPRAPRAPKPATPPANTTTDPQGEE